MFKKIKENIDSKKEIDKKLDEILEILNNIDDITVINQRSLSRVDHWKEKYNEEHKKICIYEVKAEKRIIELENEIKDLSKKLKKAEKEKENVQVQ